MLQLNSKKVVVNGSQEAVYNYISDFHNFQYLLPADQMKNIEISKNTLSFSISNLGSAGFKITDQRPFNQLVITGEGSSVSEFTIWINISVISEHQSEVDLSIQARLNMLLEMIAKTPLQQFLDLLADKFQEIKFEN
jgi:carbon monoxide dehydrogenase subunit G